MTRFILVLLLSAIAAMAETSLWKVTHAGKTMYIGGTVHLLRASDYPMPRAFDKAFDAADTVVFETDIGALNTPQFKMKMHAHLTCANCLKSSLRSNTYRSLQAYADTHRLPMAFFDSMKPLQVVMTLVARELTRIGVDRPGVDLHYYHRAKHHGKRVTWFESLDFQLKILESLGSGDPDKMVRNTLKEVDRYGAIMFGLLESWRKGETKTLERLGRQYLTHGDSKAYKRLIVDRNKEWMPAIRKMLSTKKTELVLVGALHLVGENGLIRQLKRRGYRVEQL